MAAAFAYRAGAPGFKHDWLWPNDRHVLTRWFIEYGLSAWNPHGIGGSGQVATFNAVFAYFAGLAAAGFDATSVLFISLASLFLGSVFGIGKLFEQLGLDRDRLVVRLLGFIYALSPVCFQKAVAGQLFWLAAYAALPWFAAFVWRGCRQERGSVRSFICAALIYAFSSAQIQFLVFDAVLGFVIVLAHARSSRSWIGFAIVIATGMVHDANVLIAPLGPSENFNIATYHGTLVWERGMSAPLWELALLGGYSGYDRAAVTGGLLFLLSAGKWILVAVALAGLVQRPRRGPLAFAAIGLFALVFASGWQGPAAPIFDLALFHSVFFTVFRELFHIMALYVLAVVVLAGFACARMPRTLAVVLLSGSLLTTVPFVSGGLGRLVPAITRVAGETETGYGRPYLRVPLPFQEPLRTPGLASGGLDPTRFDDDVPSNAAAPLFINWLLDPRLAAGQQRDLLADLGVRSLLWRDERVSALPDVFEPNVGAEFQNFSLRQQALHGRFAALTELADARSTVMLERRVDADPLQYVLADLDEPPGRNVRFLSSFAGNDIRREWVSLRIWSWYVPELSNLAVSDAVITKSQTPLNVAVSSGPRDTIYVLLAGRECSLDGRPGTLVPGSGRGAYRWWRWTPMRRASVAALRVGGLASVAQIRVSDDPAWPPRRSIRPPSSGEQTVATTQKWPWSLSGKLPASGQRTMVLGKAFSAGWHLQIEGADRGAARRVDGIFNGWPIDPSDRERIFTLVFVPQIRAGLLVAFSTALEAAMLGFVFWPNVRRFAQ